MSSALERNLFDAALVAATLEVGLEEGLEYAVGRSGVDEAAGHNHDVRIVVLAGKTCNLGNPTQGGPDAVVVVQCHIDAVSAAANGNAGITFACLHGRSQGVCIVGIVATFFAIRAKVFVFPAFGFEPLLDVLFQFIACMIGSKPYQFVFHLECFLLTPPLPHRAVKK